MSGSKTIGDDAVGGATPMSSGVVQSALAIAVPFAAVVGTYLLFAGHNNPGGGFAAGLVFGAGLAARTVTGMPRPDWAIELVAGGLLLIVLVALAPLVFDRALLDQAVVSVELPLLGKLKTGSALPFDIGVTAIVVGLISAVLDGLGARELAEPSNPPFNQTPHSNSSPPVSGEGEST